MASFACSTTTAEVCTDFGFVAEPNTNPANNQKRWMRVSHPSLPSRQARDLFESIVKEVEKVK